MALPALGALLARVIPAVLRTGAQVAARLGVGEAAGTVGEGVASKAAQKGAQVVASQAAGAGAEQAGQRTAKSGGSRVIQSMMGNARDITAALSGRSATPPATPVASRTSPPSLPADRIPTSPPAWAKWQTPAKPWQGEPPARPSVPYREPGATRPATSRNAMPERNPFVDPLKPTELRTTPPKVPTPMDRRVKVSEETKGMDWGQRWERLQKLGQLVDKSEVARRLGNIKNPTPEQQVQVSEAQEQRNRDKWNPPEEARESLWSFTKKGATAGTAFVLSLGLGVKALEKFASHTMDSQEYLRRFNGGIAAAFATLERQELILAGRTANATSGSTVMLGNQLKALRDEMQPWREHVITIKNHMAFVAAGIARIAAFTVAMNPVFKLIDKGLSYLERLERMGGGAPSGSDYQHFLRAIADGSWKMTPKNDRPPAARPPASRRNGGRLG